MYCEPKQTCYCIMAEVSTRGKDWLDLSPSPSARLHMNPPCFQAVSITYWFPFLQERFCKVSETSQLLSYTFPYYFFIFLFFCLPLSLLSRSLLHARRNLVHLLWRHYVRIPTDNSLESQCTSGLISFTMLEAAFLKRKIAWWGEPHIFFMPNSRAGNLVSASRVLILSMETVTSNRLD